MDDTKQFGDLYLKASRLRDQTPGLSMKEAMDIVSGNLSSQDPSLAQAQEDQNMEWIKPAPTAPIQPITQKMSSLKDAAKQSYKQKIAEKASVRKPILPGINPNDMDNDGVPTQWDNGFNDHKKGDIRKQMLIAGVKSAKIKSDDNNWNNMLAAKDQILTTGATIRAGAQPGAGQKYDTQSFDPNAQEASVLKYGDEQDQKERLLQEQIAARKENAQLMAGMRKDAQNNSDSMRKDQLEFRKQQAVFDVSNKMNNDPRMKAYMNQGLGLEQVGQLSDLVASGNTVAAAGLGAKMAKAMGETGVMTDKDVSRYVESGKLSQSAADKLSKWTKGMPTQATQQEINEITQALNSQMNVKIQPIIDEYMQRGSNTYKIPLDQMYFMSNQNKPAQINSGSSMLQRPSAPQAPSKPAISPQQAIEELKRRGKM